MSFCSQCGKAATEDAKFCSGCGTNLVGITANPVPTSEDSTVAGSPQGVPVIKPFPTLDQLASETKFNMTSPVIARDPTIPPLTSELKFQISNYDGGLASHASRENGDFLVLIPGGKWELRFPVNPTTKTFEKLFAGIARYPLDVTESGTSSCHVTVTDVQDRTVRSGFDVPSNSATELLVAIESLRQSSLVGNAAPTLKSQEHQPKLGIKDTYKNAKEAARTRSTTPKSVGYTGKIGSREELSAVGERTDYGLACPKCGGTQFTAKRSVKGKVIGIGTIGVAGLIAPKSQVKCVTCGTMYKRG